MNSPARPPGKIVSINVAKVAPLFLKEGETTHRIISGIRKQAIETPVHVGPLGIAGDEQADLSVHGGLDKAVYLYPHEHYAFWNDARERMLKQHTALLPGAMGENLTTTGVLETDLWVGDRLQMDEVILEVTEPRSPCYKFGAVMGYAQALKQMLQSGYTGVYLRVIQSGELRADGGIMLLPGRRELSIAQINDRRLRGRQRDLF
jgi:MOSC domain-containing protein YiiM